MIILNPLVLALDIFNLVRLMIVLYFIIARFGQRNCVRSLAAADIYKTILRLYLKQSGGFLKRFINNLLKFLNFLYLHEHYSLKSSMRHPSRPCDVLLLINTRSLRVMCLIFHRNFEIISLEHLVAISSTIYVKGTAFNFKINAIVCCWLD